MTYIVEDSFDNLVARSTQNKKAHIFVISPNSMKANFPSAEKAEEFTQLYIDVLRDTITDKGKVSLVTHPTNPNIAAIISEAPTKERKGEDNYAAIQRLLRRAALSPKLKDTFLGIGEDTRIKYDVGHIQGKINETRSSASVSGYVVESLENLVREKKVYDAQLDRVFNQAKKALENAHLRYTLQTKEVIDFVSSKAAERNWEVVIVQPQARAINRYLSDYEKAAKKSVINALTEKQLISAKQAKKLTEETASPSFFQNLRAGIINLFNGIKKKFRSSKKLVEKDIPLKPEVTKTVAAVNVSSEIIREQVAAKAGASPLRIQNILNANLHDYIQNRMEESGAPVSKEYLRYQTGRFAKSAEVLGVTMTRDNAVRSISYTFMMEPYAVYLGKGGRDTALYVENSIRDILKEESIAAPGVFLEMN